MPDDAPTQEEPDMPGTVAVILARKGAEVHTVEPQRPLTSAVRLLAQHRVGALVVSRDGVRVEGIISERDVVQRLAALGDAALERPISEAMSTQVRTCEPGTSVDEIMRTMTEGRIRHLPVCEDERLVGIVSIGDVVKHRLDELEVQTEALTSYVTGR
jgi:CBS domain-containing protein